VKAKPVIGLALFAALGAAGCAEIQQYLPDNPLISGYATAGSTMRIAVLPFAYRGRDGSMPCDLCPDRVVMDVTGDADALLVTGFFYEQLARHPRLQIVPFERVEAAEGTTMRETLDRLAATEKLDAVIVGALLELRTRKGNPSDPEQRGGASLYVAMLRLPSGRPVWKRLYDRTPGRAGRIAREYESLVGSDDDKALTAEEVAQIGASRMVESLARSIR
jgi:hypothetical protein